MQRNANMLKILKKVRFCRFYWFLCKNAVPSLSPRSNFCPSIKPCITLHIRYLQDHKWALKKYFASESKQTLSLAIIKPTYHQLWLPEKRIFIGATQIGCIVSP